MWSPSEGDRAAVAWMLSPVSLDEFADRYYEKAPLHISRNKPGFYNRYFSLADLESVIFGSVLRTRDINIVKDGTPARPESYTLPKSKKNSAAKDPPSEIIDPDRLSALFSGGCSVVLDDVQRFSTKIASLKRAMELCFRHHVGGNLYLTPPGNQGFSVHYDTHDTWIIQIEGSKHWRVYSDPFRLPLDDQIFNKALHSPGELLLEIEMQPGDLLYIPRGFMHEAKSNEDLSLHITLGLYPRRIIHVLEDLLTSAADDPNASVLRETFHEGSIPRVLDFLKTVFTREQLLRSDGHLEEKWIQDRRNTLDGQISEVMRLKELSEESRVGIRPGMLYTMSVSEKSTRLLFSGKTLTFGPGAAAIVRELQSVSSSTVRVLLKHDEKALSIVRKMIQEGFASQLAAEENRDSESAVA